MDIQNSHLVICGGLSFIIWGGENLGTVGPILPCHHIKLGIAALSVVHDETSLIFFKSRAFPRVDGL